MSFFALGFFGMGLKTLPGINPEVIPGAGNLCSRVVPGKHPDTPGRRSVINIAERCANHPARSESHMNIACVAAGRQGPGITTLQFIAHWLKLEFDMPHWLVIDLEATTEEGGWPVAEMEIIEIGATVVKQDGREVDHFERFVRPLRRPVLTPFCRELTHISQANVDSAAPLTTVWPLFERWLGHHQNKLAGWASWGDYDRQQFEVEWRQHQLGSALSDMPHLNLKQRFAKARQLQKPPGLKAALQLAGMNFNGPQHRALNDARNTARLLPLIMPA